MNKPSGCARRGGYGAKNLHQHDTLAQSGQLLPFPRTLLSSVPLSNEDMSLQQVQPIPEEEAKSQRSRVG